MSGIVNHINGIFLEIINRALAHRTIELSRLTKSAPPDTASLDLQHHTILCHLNKGHHRLFRIGNIIDIPDNLFHDIPRDVIIYRLKGLYRTIRMISHLIKQGAIYAGKLSCLVQKLHPVFMIAFTFLV